MDINITIPDEKVNDLANAIGYSNLKPAQQQQITQADFIKTAIDKSLKDSYREFKKQEIINANLESLEL